MAKHEKTVKFQQFTAADCSYNPSNTINKASTVSEKEHVPRMLHCNALSSNNGKWSRSCVNMHRPMTHPPALCLLCNNKRSIDLLMNSINGTAAWQRTYYLELYTPLRCACRDAKTPHLHLGLDSGRPAALVEAAVYAPGVLGYIRARQSQSLLLS